jgi:hypothetical protein
MCRYFHKRLLYQKVYKLSKGTRGHSLVNLGIGVLEEDFSLTG